MTALCDGGISLMAAQICLVCRQDCLTGLAFVYTQKMYILLLLYEKVQRSTRLSNLQFNNGNSSMFMTCF